MATSATGLMSTMRHRRDTPHAWSKAGQLNPSSQTCDMGSAMVMERAARLIDALLVEHPPDPI